MTLTRLMLISTSLLFSGACLGPVQAPDGSNPDGPVGGKADDGTVADTFDGCLTELDRQFAQEPIRTLVCHGGMRECDDTAVTPDLRRLAAYPSLTQVTLTGLCVQDLSGLELLPNLVELNLSDNDLSAAWSPVVESPFASLHALETLVLSRTNIESLAAIGASPRLRSLTADDNPDLLTLRGLMPLRTLRELNIAATEISELEPLAHMALTRLDIRDNVVSSLEPVRAAIDGGAVVLADGNCIEACTEYGEAVECGQQYPGDCYNTESTVASGEQLRVPVTELSRFLPRAPTVWTWEQASAGFQSMLAATHIDWNDAISDCNTRAMASTDVLDGEGFPEHYRIGSYGALRAIAPAQPLGFASWDWHVAIAVFVQTDAGPALHVLDPALFPDGPVVAEDWFSRQVDSAGAPLDFDCERYNRASGWDPAACEGSSMVDANGDLRVSTIDEVTGVLCSTLFAGHITVCGLER